MNQSDGILRTLGRIEGELKAQGVEISNGLAEIRALSEVFLSQRDGLPYCSREKLLKLLAMFPGRAF